MSDRLLDAAIFDSDLAGVIDEFIPLCRPRVLIVTDGSLDFSARGFGLARFVAAVQDHWAKPFLSLAHRNRPAHSVTIAGIQYRVMGNFNFASEATPVTIEIYDQIWLFGFMGGPLDSVPSRRDPIDEKERRAIAKFMNAGGGVFATGDHATIGQGMCGELPRIRHMRDWSSIPMGTEGGPIAENRIDTVTNPGLNDLYEFDDQADHIPQRIYPNYRVIWTNGAWSASIHPLLRLPTSRLSRTDNTGFRRGRDIEVLPDHPHESVCFEVSGEANLPAMNGSYKVLDLDFREFPLGRFGHVPAPIVASAVAAGRSVNANSPLNPHWKPPVKPRMFGIISAWNGHEANAFTGTAQAPGSVVCDSTWHHFVNVNLDGGGSDRSGLGTGFGSDWVPSADCLRIFRYYQNILSWLQPANRVVCRVAHDLILARFHPFLIEELMEAPNFEDPAQFAALGAEAVAVIEAERGEGALADAVGSILGADKDNAGLLGPDDAEGLLRAAGRPGPVLAYALGRTLAKLAEILPPERPDEVKKHLRSHRKLEQAVGETVAEAAREAVGFEMRRTEERLTRLSAMASYPAKTEEEG